MALRMERESGVGERIVMCNGVVFHRSQLAYVITAPILGQIEELASRLKQPDNNPVGSLLASLVFLQGKKKKLLLEK